MLRFCYNCGNEQETEVITREETSVIRGKEITSTSNIRICSVCKEELFDEVLDEANINRAYDVFRQKYMVYFQRKNKKY